MPSSRRQFLRSSSTLLAATPLIGFPRRRVAPSDTLYVGLIGCRNMGFGDLRQMLKVDGVVCTALCDVDQNILEERSAELKERTGRAPATYRDHRELLADEALDAVIIGTPDHWHCLQTVDALAAGKHVYVEKPLANSIAEIDAIKEAARRSDKVLQVGQQQRSGAHWQEVVRLVRSGRLGTLRRVNLWANFRYGMGPERAADAPVPQGVDYDRWLGPAPERPFNPNRFHSSWRFFWDYGGGLMTDWGVHLLDIPLWALDIDGPPRSIHATGGLRSRMDRDIEVADTQTTVYAFDDLDMVWQHDGGRQSGPYDRPYGIAFVGNLGTLVVNRQGWELLPEYADNKPLTEPVPFQKGKGGNHDLHAANFIDCIRHGRTPNCPVEAGHLSALYAHYGNIAYRSGETLHWDSDGALIHKDRVAKYIQPAYRSPWAFPKG